MVYNSVHCAGVRGAGTVGMWQRKKLKQVLQSDLRCRAGLLSVVKGANFLASEEQEKQVFECLRTS